MPPSSVIFIERISHSVDETIARVRALLATKGIREFAFIDHSVEAEKARLSMPKTQVLVFGNPKGSTPLMLAAPSIALDLPLKLLVREDVAGDMWLSYWSAQTFLNWHGLAESFTQNIAVTGMMASRHFYNDSCLNR
jgi:uncharacterized protein (DUF302 family)